MPWYPPVKASAPERPVAVCISLSAASTASVPAGPQKCTRARAANSAGRLSNSALVKSSFSAVARSSRCSGAPLSRVRRMASSTTGWLWPSASVPAPERQSR